MHLTCCELARAPYYMKWMQRRELWEHTRMPKTATTKYSSKRREMVATRWQHTTNRNYELVNFIQHKNVARYKMTSMIADAFACWKPASIVTIWDACTCTYVYDTLRVESKCCNFTSCVYLYIVRAHVNALTLQLKLRKESLHLSKCSETKTIQNECVRARVCVCGKYPILDHLAICVAKKTKVVFYFVRFVSRF